MNEDQNEIHRPEQEEEHEYDEQAEEPEHETHVSALVVLVLVTGVVAVVALIYGQVQLSPQAEAPQEQAQRDDPVTYQRTQPVETTDDIPSGLLFGNFELVQNRVLDVGSRQQRIVVYDTNSTPSSLTEEFRAWLENTDYEISSESVKSDGGSYMADRGDKRVTIVFSQRENTDSTRVQLNYID